MNIAGAVGEEEALGSRTMVEPGHGSGTRGWRAQCGQYDWGGGRHGRLGSLSGASDKGDSYGEEWEEQEDLGEAMVGESMRPEDCPRVNAARRRLLGRWRH